MSCSTELLARPFAVTVDALTRAGTSAAVPGI